MKLGASLRWQIDVGRRDGRRQLDSHVVVDHRTVLPSLIDALVVRPADRVAAFERMA